MNINAGPADAGSSGDGGWFDRARRKINPFVRMGLLDQMAEVVPSEPGGDATPERVMIAEKVRFWEEQDRINGVLIPRVLRMNETLTKITEQLSAISQRLEESEGRTRSAVRDAEHRLGLLEAFRDEVLSLQRQFAEDLQDGPSKPWVTALEAHRRQMTRLRFQSLLAACVAAAFALISVLARIA
jgi:hypothetical protein